jgi:hypothetical protein
MADRRLTVSRRVVERGPRQRVVPVSDLRGRARAGSDRAEQQVLAGLAHVDPFPLRLQPFTGAHLRPVQPFARRRGDARGVPEPRVRHRLPRDRAGEQEGEQQQVRDRGAAGRLAGDVTRGDTRGLRRSFERRELERVVEVFGAVGLAAV